ncbi:uncharacterized protein N7515_009258 [Penicillium bovifimosum]|uniref:Uncharacterized protein n=1 Tax=Penicillium bovifimosum TaxID=126998 RepID=A0A9W9KVC1_9EURO|nr:uncharacterized protein N7515_009258 [Penicillium bovifimosum]KAJ5121297.1 hypothetical protein N7515_009258 [Penicillium bovifimosum]
MSHCPVHRPDGAHNYEKQFLAAGEDFIIKFCDERRYLSLGDSRRSKTIRNLRKLVKQLDAIIDLAEMMARYEPRCRTIRFKPTDHFHGEFQRLVTERITHPIVQAIEDLEAAEEAGQELDTADFMVANDLFQIQDYNPLLTWEPLPESMVYTETRWGVRGVH